jgi:hypothetical protein
MKKIRNLSGLMILFLFYACTGRVDRKDINDFSIQFSGDAKIEVGGPFVGAEFHHSYPVPQRISFFYPIANSIDMSTDYWFRDTTLAMEIGLKIGSNSRQNISWKPSEIELTPYHVKFQQDNIQIAYQFSKNKPAMVVTFIVKNKGNKTELYELDTRLQNTLRTCHTYRWIYEDMTDYNFGTATAVTRYADEEIENVVVFVTNGAEKPVQFLPERNATTFIYKQELSPGDEMKIVQIIGSSYADETSDMIEYLSANFQNEINLYEEYVTNKATKEYEFKTENPILNQSVSWAKAMLASLIHYVDGEFVPMPCPAEYNFYFTHDALVTDLAAVNFDLPRVKRDIEYLLDHATEDFIIPHAYYWKDGKYMTEYADSNNWNHFWFIQLAASYLRHSGDKDLLNRAYPYLENSLEYSLHSKEEDGLLYAYYLDGWDIGHNFGPRAFMTIMAVKGIQDFIYISTILDKNPAKLRDYGILAKHMETSLEEKLWNEESGFLMNFYENGDLDPHYYAGSLLAVHFGLLDDAKRKRLIETAGNKLVDPNIGVYTVYPPDFHLLGDYLKFKGNEVGPPYHYANGGVWNHCNAWYSLGLMAVDQRYEAAQFIRKNMTLDGIINSPNGQPAMYEYRCSDKNNPQVYGTIDKPNFLWAAGWYLYSLYHLYGIEENAWNISLKPYMPDDQESCTFDINLSGKKTELSIQGQGDSFRKILKNGKEWASAVFMEKEEGVDYRFFCGFPEYPYLESAHSVVSSCNYDYKTRTLNVRLKTFAGYRNDISIVSPFYPEAVTVEGGKSVTFQTEITDRIIRIKIGMIHEKAEQNMQITFVQ